MKSNSGFTLIELLMVIVVLSVIIALAVPNFKQTLKHFELKKTAQDIVYMVRWAQSRAIQDNAEYRLVFLNDSSRYQILRANSSSSIDGKKFNTIPIRMGRMMNVPRSVRISDAKELTIYPDGTLQKVRITLESQGQKWVISSMEQRGNLFILEDAGMNRKGVILIEAIVATVIMAISLTVILQSLVGSYRSVTLQKDYTQALILAENHLSKYWFDAEDSIKAASSKIPSKFKYEGTLSERDSSLKTAVLTIRWPVGHGQRQLAVSSLVYVPHANQ